MYAGRTQGLDIDIGRTSNAKESRYVLIQQHPSTAEIFVLTRQQHGDDAGDKYAIKGASATNRGDGCSQLSNIQYSQKIGADKYPLACHLHRQAERFGRD